MLTLTFLWRPTLHVLLLVPVVYYLWLNSIYRFPYCLHLPYVYIEALEPYKIDKVLILDCQARQIAYADAHEKLVKFLMPWPFLIPWSYELSLRRRRDMSHISATTSCTVIAFPWIGGLHTGSVAVQSLYNVLALTSRYFKFQIPFFSLFDTIRHYISNVSLFIKNMAPDLNSLASNGRWDYSKPGFSGYDIPNIIYNVTIHTYHHISRNATKICLRIRCPALYAS